MDQEDVMAMVRSDDGVAPERPMRRFVRTFALVAGFVMAILIAACLLEIAHYRPLEVGGYSGTTANSEVTETPGTVFVKYVVFIGNKGPFSVQLTKVLPDRLGLTGQEKVVVRAFLPTSNIYGEHHPFHSVTIAPGQYLGVGIRIAFRCFPLIGGNSHSIVSQSFVIKVFGFSETQTLSFSGPYPMTIVGPQDCTSKG
jgi:hypothetical protein